MQECTCIKIMEEELVFLNTHMFEVWAVDSIEALLCNFFKINCYHGLRFHAFILVEYPPAVSYNFAVDQYVPWVARVGAQPSFPGVEVSPRGSPGPAPVGGYPRGLGSTASSRASSQRSGESQRSRPRSELGHGELHDNYIS